MIRFRQTAGTFNFFSVLALMGAPVVWIAAVLVFVLGAAPSMCAIDPIYAKTFEGLKKEVEDRKTHLARICTHVLEKVDQFGEDRSALDFYDLADRFFRTGKDGAHGSIDTSKSVQIFDEIRDSFLNYYFEKYSMFYDVMLIDKNGDIFFTVRQEKDMGQNIFSGSLAETNLSKSLKNITTGSFVDFQFFSVSGEPAAFFVKPVYSGKELRGWFILQWAINKLNSLFSGSSALGRTGEVILVNQDHFLLTDSRFLKNSSSLALRLNSKNISIKFKEKKGSRIVMDYRGKRVLSHFEVFSFLGAEWLLSAKVDENEIITDYFRDNRVKVLQFLYSQNYSYPCENPEVLDTDNALKVDMEEFARGDGERILYTHGISTCTGLVISKPGDFAYMIHISPYDRVYSPEVFFTSLVGQVLSRLPMYDICQNDFGSLKFYIISNHDKAVGNILDRITAAGFFLSQVEYLRNPSAASANVYYDPKNDKINIWWLKKTGGHDAYEFQQGDERCNLERKTAQLLN